MSPKHSHAQMQSLFFHLPRELRDEIYELYTGGADGYTYDFKTQKMQTRCTLPDGSVNLETASCALQLTCQRVADEMRGITLRSLTFTTSSPPLEPKATSFRGTRSKAERMHCLYECVQLAKRDMLVYAASCVSPEIVQLLQQDDPTFRDIFGRQLQKAMRCGGWTTVPWHNDQNRQVIDDAVQRCIDLVLARDRETFESLASRAFISEKAGMTEDESITFRPIFKEGSMSTVLNCHLNPWSIPTEEELSSMEGLLNRRVTQEELDRRARWPGAYALDHLMIVRDRVYDYSSGIRWYHSGASIASNFLRHLSPLSRKHVRRIVINEQAKAVCNMECHLRGLLPFCQENPKLRVEVRASISDAVVPANWTLLRESSQDECGAIVGDIWLRSMSAWLREIALLPCLGLRSGSIRVIFWEKTTEASSDLWPMFRSAALMQGAMLESAHRQLVSTPDWWTDYPEPGFDAIHRLPCHLSVSFTALITDAVKRCPKALIVYDGDIGEPWDAEEELEARKQYSLEDWRTEWHRDVARLRFATPPEYWRRLRSAYRLEDDAS